MNMKKYAATSFAPLPEVNQQVFPDCFIIGRLRDYFPTSLLRTNLTHMMYGLTKDNVAQAEEWLKSLGGKDFQTVKCHKLGTNEDNGYRVLAFRWPTADATDC